MKNKGFVVITGQNCPKCPQLKKMLKAIGIDFTEIDIETYKKENRNTEIKGLPTLKYQGYEITYGCPNTLDALSMCIYRKTGLVKAHKKNIGIGGLN